MGYMAQLRNLRNFEAAGVDKAILAAVSARLADPEQVTRSRQLPLRFYSAWKATESMTFGPALETALDACLANIPALPGSTLVMIDVSGSMGAAMSKRSQAQRWELAALFGSALARRAAKADVHAYADKPTRVVVTGSTSVLRGIDAIRPLVGGGTRTWDCVKETYEGHDRVVILTDEQAFAPATPVPGQRPDEVVPERVPVYTFNLAGYKHGHAPAVTNRYTFGGLSDAGFAAIELLERRRSVTWDALIA